MAYDGQKKGGVTMDAEIIALFQKLSQEDKKIVLDLAAALSDK